MAHPDEARARVDAFDRRALPGEFYDDPYPTYRVLRELDPEHRCPHGSRCRGRLRRVPCPGRVIALAVRAAPPHAAP